ncbi:hypothetical protein PQR67_16855 [Paraburkholderia fungorum]|uniref:hypothetical protein n=1 Tax=Paraburkholderia fungorum TaxID=134537 RepID=UPI0038B6B98C
MKKAYKAILALLLMIGAASVHAAGTTANIPPSCEELIQFVSTCGADIRSMNNKPGVHDSEMPSPAALRNDTRARLQKLGFDNTNQVCIGALQNIQGQLSNLVMGAAFQGRQFSDKCQTAMVSVMATVKKASADARAASNPDTLNGAAAQQGEIAKHNAITAVQWAQSMKANTFNGEAAFNYARQALADVSRSCPDAMAVLTGPGALIVSKQCGYVVSYDDADYATQISFDQDVIDRRLAECAAPAVSNEWHNKCATK